MKQTINDLLISRPNNQNHLLLPPNHVRKLSTRSIKDRLMRCRNSHTVLLMCTGNHLSITWHRDSLCQLMHIRRTRKSSRRQIIAFSPLLCNRETCALHRLLSFSRIARGLVVRRRRKESSSGVLVVIMGGSYVDITRVITTLRTAAARFVDVSR